MGTGREREVAYDHGRQMLYLVKHEEFGHKICQPGKIEAEKRQRRDWEKTLYVRHSRRWA
jgi:hypothetical protein